MYHLLLCNLNTLNTKRERMLKKFLAYMLIICTCLFASDQTEVGRLVTERNVRVRPTVKEEAKTGPKNTALNRAVLISNTNADDRRRPSISIKQCAVVAGWVTFDYCMQGFWNPENLSRNSAIGMTFATANHFLPTIVDQFLEREYRGKFTEAFLVAGFCFAPKVTVMSYAFTWALDKLAGKHVTAAILGYVYLDNTMQYLVSKNSNQHFITTSMMFSAVNTLIPDIVELVAGTSYREKITQAIFVAGLCLAPEITIGSYALSWALEKLAESYIASPTAKRAFTYWTARTGGIAGGILSFWRK